ncbi:hypothetical protein AMTR_s00061p00034260 [Amborella trichopoda]|uniref:Peptidase A1 domain-containing protein n=2 Tax=Amborella trichopoda TaxID=13333 RepID=U5D938_AMBTC|nr:hypothetical protein AMTR_s00061p00034260 [Amborella trichopoda]
MRTAFQKLTSEYPSTEPLSMLDTCYNFRGYEDVTIPSIGLHFGGGVEVDVHPSGILIGASTEQVCLAFASNEDIKDVAIIGTMQQQTHKVVYDLPNARIGFSPGACS